MISQKLYPVYFGHILPNSKLYESLPNLKIRSEYQCFLYSGLSLLSRCQHHETRFLAVVSSYNLIGDANIKLNRKVILLSYSSMPRIVFSYSGKYWPITESSKLRRMLVLLSRSSQNNGVRSSRAVAQIQLSGKIAYNSSKESIRL